ncbi:MAG: hypothetical protein ABIJ08_02055 [Nanoarchaeota archaeon]
MNEENILNLPKNKYRYPILINKESTTHEFIYFWSRQYLDGKYSEKYYEDNINKEFTELSLKQLLEWKNGMSLSPNKRKILDKSVLHIADLRNFRDRKVDKLPKLTNGLVWTIFFKHICRPEEFPMIDQHAYRAFLYIVHGIPQKKIQGNDLIDKYDEFKEYVFRLSNDHQIELRIIDKAFMAYGQFLKSQFYKMIG